MPEVKDPATMTATDIPDPVPQGPHPENPYRKPGAPKSPDPVETQPGGMPAEKGQPAHDAVMEKIIAESENLEDPKPPRRRR